MKKQIVSGIFILIILLVCKHLSAQGFPQLGHYFYGEVFFSNIPAAPGGIIVAEILGTTLVYSTTIDSQGRFGYNPNFAIPGDDLATPEREGAQNGDQIVFFLDDKPLWLFDPYTLRLLGKQISFQSGETTYLRLNIVTPARVTLPLVVR